MLLFLYLKPHNYRNEDMNFFANYLFANGDVANSHHHSPIEVQPCPQGLRWKLFMHDALFP